MKSFAFLALTLALTTYRVDGVLRKPATKAAASDLKEVRAARLSLVLSAAWLVIVSLLFLWFLFHAGRIIPRRQHHPSRSLALLVRHGLGFD